MWQTECIARIDPATAAVTGWILLDGITAKTRAEALSSGSRRMDVLNGIAWDAGARRLFVTGKYWPSLYEVRIVERPFSAAALADARARCIRKVR